MKKEIYLIILLSLFISGIMRAQELPTQTVVPGKWIKSWLLCGPFPVKDPLVDPQDLSKSWDHLIGFETDFLKKEGGEQNLKVKIGDVVRYTGGSAKWVLYTSPDSAINFNKVITKDAPAVGYAYTEVETDESKMWFAVFGTRDGGRLWVNGVEVWDYPIRRKQLIDDDFIPVILKKGKNTILFKIEKRSQGWLLFPRFLPFSVAKLAERGELFRIKNRENGECELTSQFLTTVLQQLVQNLDIKVLDHQKNQVLREQRQQNFCGEIDLKSNDYQPYTALLDINLKNGETMHQEINFTSGKPNNYVLFSNKKTNYRIALDTSASESEQWAAKELQYWLKEISGTEFPIQTLDQPHEGPQIVLGYNNLIKDKTGAIAPAILDESFRYCNSGPDIFIYGGKQRGTMYGVMTFLENELGCRWYTPTVTVFPKREELKFNWYDHAEAPAFRIRMDGYLEAFDPIWAARNKVNSTRPTQKQPGGIESYWSVHTFYRLVPPTEFYDKHPEYYSLIDGKRIYKNAQLCLTNPDVLKIVIERIKKQMRESPEYLVYDVSQNDWFNPCQCDKCQAIVKQEGSESGVMIWFVNQVAEAVEKEFPGKFIGTLAYQYTRKPCKSIRPRDNVVVRLCSIECCFSHDIKSCPRNQAFLEDLKSWSAIAPHLYIWDYVVNFSHYIMPYPNMYVLQSNMKTFREFNVTSVKEQANSQSRGGEFSELKAYLISRLLWNPDCNTEEVINDFMNDFYGRAGKYVHQYFDLLYRQITPETHIHISLSHDDPIFSDEFVRKSCQIFENAEKVADNDEILQRVEMAYLQILYLKCWKMPATAKYDGSYDKLCQIVKREKVTQYQESGQFHVISFHNGVENAK
jgi:hypothetical protein